MINPSTICGISIHDFFEIEYYLYFNKAFLKIRVQTKSLEAREEVVVHTFDPRTQIAWAT